MALPKEYRKFIGNYDACKSGYGRRNASQVWILFCGKKNYLKILKIDQTSQRVLERRKQNEKGIDSHIKRRRWRKRLSP